MRGLTWLMVVLGLAFGQTVYWLDGSSKTIRTNGVVLLEFWSAARVIAAPSQYQISSQGLVLRLEGRGEGALEVEVDGKRHRFNLENSRLAPGRYILRTPKTTEGLSVQVFRLGPNTIGYSIINRSNDTYTAEESLLEISIPGWTLERTNSAKSPGVLPPGASEYGVLRFAEAVKSIGLTWVLLGSNSPLIVQSQVD